jgi:hypothetical protein
MNLMLAKLCRDCEEIHSEPRCPTCDSKYWDPITKFVPSVLRGTPDQFNSIFYFARASNGQEISH